MKLPHIITLILCLACMQAYAGAEIRFGNESTDTTAINRLLDLGKAQNFRSGEDAVAFYGRHMLGRPYAAHTLEGDSEVVTVRIDSVDCTTYVETALALAYTTREGRNSWRDFVYNLRRIRYRGGEVNGYPSRLHYIADWAVDNRHRGNFADVSDRFPRVGYVTRTIDFMSRHRHLYPSLADSANYERMRAVENGYRLHRFPYVKTADLGIKAVRDAFHNGDVVALVSNLKDLDVTHMGIVVKDAPTATPYLMHASSSHGKVEITTQPLDEFLRKNRQWIGVRVFRLND